MKHKSVITRRRLIITFILATILTVSIATGFSGGFNSDSHIYSADGERIVMWQDLPGSGDPSDYDLISDIKFAAQKLYTASYFCGETQGDVVANVGLGIKYTQNVKNRRVVKGDTIFSESISSSSLKSVAEQKYFKGDTILYRPSTSVKGATATWSDSVAKMPREDFFKAYGVVPNELTKYAINEDNILSVTDDNALSADAKNADGDTSDKPALVIPQNLVPDESGNYSVTLELDPADCTKFYRNEVRTLASADQNPVFYWVKITIVFDSEWNPVSVTSNENYDIAIPVLGAMNCTSLMTETFSNINEDGDIPEKDFFEAHLNDEGGDFSGPGLSPADYLASAFACYLDGSSDLGLKADLNINGVSVEGLRISVNIATLDIKAKLGALSIQYSDDKVYITLNDIKGYLAVSDIMSVADDPAISGLLGALPDFSGMFGDDILATVFADCEKTSSNGVTQIRLPFSLADGIDIDASLFINDSDLTLNRITGNIKAFGLDIDISAKPASSTFPAVDSSYTDLSGVIDFVKDGIATALGKTYGISGTIDALGYNIGVDAYIDRTDGLVADATVTALGQDINIKYLDDVIYAELGNIKLKAEPSDFPELISAITELMGVNTGALDTVKRLLPQSVNGWINCIKSLTITDSTLSLGAELIVPINVTLSRADGKLSKLTAKVDSTVLSKKIKADAELNITTPDRRTVSVSGDYTPLSALTPIIPALKPYLNANTFELTLNNGSVKFGSGDSAKTITVGGSAKIALDKTGDKTKLSARAALDISGIGAELIYTDGKVFLTVADNAKIKFDIANDLDTVKDYIAEMLEVYGLSLDSESDGSTLIDDLVGAVRSLSVSGNTVKVEVSLLGITTELSLDPVTGSLGVKLVSDSINGAVSATVTASAATSAIAAPSESAQAAYIDAAELVEAIKPLASDAYTLTLNDSSITVDGKAYTFKTAGDGIALKVIKDEAGIAGVELDGALLALGQTASVKYVGGVIYLSINDSVKLKIADGKIKEFADKITELAAAFSSPAATVAAFNNAASAPDAVETFTLADGTFTAVINAAGLKITLTASADGIVISAAGTLDGIAIDVAASIAPATAQSVTVSPVGAAEQATYVALTDLYPLLSAVKTIATDKGLGATVSVELGGKTLNLALGMEFSDGLKLRLTESSLGLDVTLADGIAYISVGGIKAKCATEDVGKFIDPLLPVLPDMIVEIVDMFRNFDLQALLDMVLGGVQSFALTGTASPTLELDLGFDIGGTTITVGASIALDLKLISVTAVIDGSTVGATVRVNNNVPAIAAPTAAAAAAYVDLTALLPALNAVAPLLGEDGYNIAVDLKLFDVAITGAIKLALATDDAPLKVEADLSVGTILTQSELDAANGNGGNAPQRSEIKLGIIYIDAHTVENLDGTTTDVCGKLYLNLDNKFKFVADTDGDSLTELFSELKDVLNEFKPEDPEEGSADADKAETIDKIITALDSIQGLMSDSELDISSLLDGVSLAHTVTETVSTVTATIALDGGDDGLDATIVVGIAAEDGALSAITLDIAIDEMNISVELGATLENDTLSKLTIPTGEDAIVSGEISLTDTLAQQIATPADYTDIGLLTQYVKPAAAIVADALGKSYISLGLGATVSFENSDGELKYTDVRGTVNVKLPENSKLAVAAQITLFAGTSSELNLYVRYVDDMLYLSVGGIKINVDLSPSVDADGNHYKNDLEKLYDTLADRALLPAYLTEQLGMMLKVVEGRSAFDTIGLLIDRFIEMTELTEISDIVNSLFTSIGNMGSDCAVKTILNMVSIATVTDEITGDDMLSVGVSLMDFIDLSIRPVLSASGDEISALALTTNLLGADVYAEIGDINFAESGAAITAPVDRDEYVSLMEFVKVIDSAIGTFTTKYKANANALGDITFEIKDLDFVYDATYNGKIASVKDDDGNDVKKEKIIVTATEPDGKQQSAVKGKLVAYEKADGSIGYRVNIEAHVTIQTLVVKDKENESDPLTFVDETLTGPIELDAYIIDDGVKPTAYLCYRETATKCAENVSIDFTSALELVASVMDIMGAHDAVDFLLKNYKINVNTKVFDSMLEGNKAFDNIKEMLNDLAFKAECYITAGKYALNAFDKIKDAGDIETLKTNLDDIKADISVAVDAINGKLPEKDEEQQQEPTQQEPQQQEPTQQEPQQQEPTQQEPQQQEPTQQEPQQQEPAQQQQSNASASAVDGSQIKGILEGIALGCNNDSIWANIDNSLTVENSDEGNATLTVNYENKKYTTEEDGEPVEHNNYMLSSGKVENLDGKTALIDMDVNFVSGEPVEIETRASVITSLPAGYTAAYSDLGQIKHLIFDIMNTANMLQFECGTAVKDGKKTESIELTVTIPLINKDIVVDVNYTLQVKLFNKAERATVFGETIAADDPEYKPAVFFELNYRDCMLDLGLGDLGKIYFVGDCDTRLYFYDNYIYIDGVKKWKKESIDCSKLLVSGDKVTYFKCDRTYIKYSFDDLKEMFDQPKLHDFIYNFLYLLMPVTDMEINYLFGKIVIKDAIADAIAAGEKSIAPRPYKTLASVFKSYDYDESTGKHTAVIGLAELANNSDLDDLTIQFTGAGHENDNDKTSTVGILDNYVESAYIQTKFVNMVEIKLNATLDNVDKEHLEEKGVLKPLDALTAVTIKNPYYEKENVSTLGKPHILHDLSIVHSYTSFEDLIKGELGLNTTSPYTWLTVEQAKADSSIWS